MRIPMLNDYGLVIHYYYYYDTEVNDGTTQHITKVVIPYPFGKEVHATDQIFDYPVNLTNGFNLINVYSNIVQSNINTSDYLSSFVINTANGINVSNPGVPSNFSNSNKPINR